MKITQRPSPNFDDRPDDVAIDMLVLHYTGMETGTAALDRLCNEESKVSSHYLVEEDGTIIQLVEDTKRAWHAGASYWSGRESLNAYSVGIEIVNPGHEWGYQDFPEVQMEAVKDLSVHLIKTHGIPQYNVVAHSDIAPDRKEDPGEKFDWKFMARNGVGIWPAAYDVMQAPDMREAMKALGIIGYKVGTNEQNFQAVRAFQRRYRGNQVDGNLDKITYGRILALAEIINAHKNP